MATLSFFPEFDTYLMLFSLLIFNFEVKNRLIPVHTGLAWRG